MTAPDVAAIAAGLVHGLNKTWKDALIEKASKSERTAIHMMNAGLVEEYSQWTGFGWVRFDRLTPLGLAVRKHLETRDD